MRETIYSASVELYGEPRTGTVVRRDPTVNSRVDFAQAISIEMNTTTETMNDAGLFPPKSALSPPEYVTTKNHNIE